MNNLTSETTKDTILEQAPVVQIVKSGNLLRGITPLQRHYYRLVVISD